MVMLNQRILYSTPTIQNVYFFVWADVGGDRKHRVSIYLRERKKADQEKKV